MSTAPLTTVTAEFLAPSGAHIEGVKVTAIMSNPAIWQGVVLPRTVDMLTDAEGLGSFKLAPSDIVSGQTLTYSIKIAMPGQVVPLWYHGVVVPRTDTVTLSQLLGWISETGSLMFDGESLLIDGLPLVFA